MGYTKRFALWVANAVYTRKMTDNQIIAAISAHKNLEMGGLREQIEAVRRNPDLYKPFASQTGNVYEFFKEMRAAAAEIDIYPDNDDDYLP
jgi:hypothetical protein